MEAMNIVKQYVPHVVMTDILMPEWNGIELAKAIQASYPQIKILILSAYDDFKYAQDAIRYGVKGYLLKPLMKEDFTNVMHGIALELKKDESIAKDKISEAGAREEASLIALIKGEPVHQHHTPWLHNYKRIAVCSFDKQFEKDQGLSIRQFITQISAEFWMESSTRVLFYGNHLVLFIHDTRPISKYELKGKFERFSDTVKESVMSRYGKQCMLSIGIGSMVEDPGHICTSFNQAIYSLSQKFFDEFASVIFYQDITVSHSEESSKEQLNEHLGVVMNQLIQTILSQNKGETAHLLRDFFDAVERGKLRLEEVQITFSEFILSLLMKAKERRLQVSALDKKQALQQIYRAETFADLKKWIKVTLETFLDHAKVQGPTDGNRYVQLAKQHVLSCFNEKITLEIMAQRLYIHPSYFSSIFKKETGQNFIDFVNEVRVWQAVELLRKKDCKIKDICAAVGFHNYSYFIKVFKKVTGANPLEFRSDLT